MAIRAVLLDADGVLQRQDVTLHSVLTDILALPPEDVEERYMEVWKAEGPALAGQGSFHDTMSDLLAEWGRPGRVGVFIDASKTIRADQDIVGIVRGLRSRGVLCCLASNQMHYRARYMSGALGYSELFDREFYSCDMGRKKPDTAYFQAILDELGLPPGDALFIDDQEANVAGARSVGIHAEAFQPGPGVEPRRLMRSILAEYGLDAGEQAS